jgi:putative Holliday junction resolvase
MNKNILLGLDVGEKTIGVAVCDGMQMIASPVCTVQRRKFADDMAELSKIIQQYHAVGVVIGLPVNMDGSHGKRVQSVRSFASNLQKNLSIEVHFWDERMSSQVAEKMMLSMDISRQRRAERIDKLAATYILQGFLDAKQFSK